MNQQFWYDDASILINQDYIGAFIPTNNMTQNEKLNSIMRFGLYLSLILILMTANTNYIFIVIGAAVLTYLMYINQGPNEPKNIPMDNDMKKYLDSGEQDPKKKDELILPSKENPFGNVLVTDLGKGKTEDPPTDLYNKQFEEIINKDVFHEQEHMFKDKMSTHTFYKPPNTYDSESRKKFMDWCYVPPKFKDSKNEMN